MQLSTKLVGPSLPGTRRHPSFYKDTAARGPRLKLLSHVFASRNSSLGRFAAFSIYGWIQQGAGDGRICQAGSCVVDLTAGSCRGAEQPKSVFKWSCWADSPVGVRISCKLFKFGGGKGYAFAFFVWAVQIYIAICASQVPQRTPVERSRHCPTSTWRMRGRLRAARKPSAKKESGVRRGTADWRCHNYNVAWGGAARISSAGREIERVHLSGAAASTVDF